MLNDYKIINPDSIVIEESVKIGKNVTILGNCYILGNSIIEDNVTIYPFTYIDNSYIGENTKVMSSFLEECKIGKNNNIGPYARLRPNTTTCDNVKIGNFVEIKNSFIGSNTKASHLAYIGDAEIQENVNIGCGVIFANYNGKVKNKTFVGRNSFIGSNSNLIAPLSISEDTYICAGTTLTTNTDKDDFVIGRVRPTIKKEKANKYLKKDN
ncbi:MAG: hypothetical protein IJ008_04380 [Clostridia bacterium]|nr:hypothetical protein [Clostridia bacterium]